MSKQKQKTQKTRQVIQETTAPEIATPERDPHARGLEHKMEGRAPRVSMSAGGKLDVPDSLKIAGFQYYWAVDRPGDLERFEAAWWEFVTDKKDGRKITTPAGNGETHYLMRIPQQYYDEDIQKQQDRVNDNLVESARLKEGEYVPKDRQGVLEREVIV
jgi:hypothetical protein